MIVDERVLINTAKNISSGKMVTNLTDGQGLSELVYLIDYLERRWCEVPFQSSIQGFGVDTARDIDGFRQFLNRLVRLLELKYIKFR